MLNILRINTRTDNAAEKLQLLRNKLRIDGNIVSEAGKKKTVEIFGEPLTPVQVVKKICKDIKERGLDALLEYSQKIDGAELTAGTLRVSEEELNAAYQRADKKLLDAVKKVRDNIWTFQEAILTKSVRVERPGGYLTQRYRPLKRTGVCVPGGAAAYPSTVLMSVVPAKVAGVKEIAVMAPPTKFGAYNDDMLAVCTELGVNEVYRMGGAQGVAALAYGVNGRICPAVDKIVGPGNLFVALAKRYVFGEVDIDSIAGPSEVVVIVDKSTNPVFTAYDLLAQAEHSPGASILIGWDEDILNRTLQSVEEQLNKIERGALAKTALQEFGAVILTKDADESCRLTDEIAPEHLHIATENAEELADKINCAGAMFLGNNTPVAVGDYAAGPSHVLPTGGTARFASGLTCNDFLRGNSILSFDAGGLKELAPLIDVIAAKEGLTAHRESAMKRIQW
ncbi:MAG: histidinol dehydrogenase [Planctomycetaceae bacterium]|jgi:histidinol dehydrogenase|nr:histidinol dehydrogenase [Planctomycetaceae bacterium]